MRVNRRHRKHSKKRSNKAERENLREGCRSKACMPPCIKVGWLFVCLHALALAVVLFCFLFPLFTHRCCPFLLSSLHARICAFFAFFAFSSALLFLFPYRAAPPQQRQHRAAHVWRAFCVDRRSVYGLLGHRRGRGHGFGGGADTQRVGGPCSSPAQLGGRCRPVWNPGGRLYAALRTVLLP